MNTLSRFFLCGCVLASVSLVPLPVFAQQDTNARLNRLENEIQTLSRALFKGEMPPAGEMTAMGQGGGADAAGLEIRLQQIEMEVRNLTGRLEQQGYEQRTLQEKIERALADFEMRIADMEARSGGAGNSSGNVAPYRGIDTQMQGKALFPANIQPEEYPADDVPAMRMTGPGVAEDAPAAGQLGTLSKSADGMLSGVSGSPADAYEQAYALLRDKNYDAAEKSFTDFLGRYPSHDLAANAKYWLGETFYVRGNFERAARVFAEAYQLYPKGPKGPDNLLKLALSLNGMGKKDDACLSLKQLAREYPAGSAPVLARAEREAQNMGCQ